MIKIRNFIGNEAYIVVLVNGKKIWLKKLESETILFCKEEKRIIIISTENNKCKVEAGPFSELVPEEKDTFIFVSTEIKNLFSDRHDLITEGEILNDGGFSFYLIGMRF